MDNSTTADQQFQTALELADGSKGGIPLAGEGVRLRARTMVILGARR